MSYETLIQSITREIGISTPAIPTTLASITDEELLQINAHIYRTIREVTDRVEWPKLTKTCVITLVSGQDAYALPEDLDLQIFRTFWDRGNFWELQGPTSAQEWEWRLNGVVTSTPRKRFRMIGCSDNQFYLNPTPGDGDAGDTISFEYQSKTSVVPVTWTEATIYAANSYSFYDGSIYKTAAGGTSGSIPPGTVPGPIYDGGVYWTEWTTPYNVFIASTDTCLIDETMISLGAQWRFLYSKALPYQETKAEYEKALQRASVRSRGAKTLSLAGRSDRSPFIGLWNVPDTGYPE